MAELREEFKDALAEKVTGGYDLNDGTQEYCEKCRKTTQHINGECVECKITLTGLFGRIG